MKKILKIIGVILLLVIVFVLIAGLVLPKTYHVERDITINAPREKVWDNTSTLHGLHSWSPWIEADPNVKITYEGQDGTIGAAYKWEGNSDVGMGVQTISKTEKPNSFDTHIHFIKPFDGEADSYINLSDAGSSTKVTWSLDGKYAYPMNTMQLFMNMDKMIGDKYNTGLGKLKTLCESN
ncbi:SRPBCC family protein [Panacibacter ginsenosidivorans]|uniref:SRPBCC family protein n=1 Tax=Panacibacter ginsenosidivorans TaxID=1813871 RepID=A0A5B8V6K1_9BACT|nr:SRPBCC family protein [Panacibacter ginsenosidivorans]QEC66513.1 SRPBCC family protein [Panacibacter ginsenosidivorans]